MGLAGVDRYYEPYDSERILVGCWLDSFASVNPVPCLEPVRDGWPVHHAEDCGSKSVGQWWGYDWPQCPAAAIGADRRLTMALVVMGLADMGQPADMTGYAAWVSDYVAEIKGHRAERVSQLSKGILLGPSRGG